MKRILALLLVACLATSALAAPKPTTCKKTDYGCMNLRSFCLAGRIIDCAAGTQCSKFIANKKQSPCIVPRPPCEGIPDYKCNTPTSFCQAGRVLKCGAGTKCKASPGSISPCVTA